MRIERINPPRRDPLSQAITLAAYKRLEQAGKLNWPLTDARTVSDTRASNQGFDDATHK